MLFILFFATKRYRVNNRLRQHDADSKFSCIVGGQQVTSNMYSQRVLQIEQRRPGANRSP